MISLADLTRELQRCWLTQAPDGVPTQFPGTTLDASGLSCWFEFWISGADEPVHRPLRSDLLWIHIDVHCFSRSPEKRRVQEMADSVRCGLGGRLLLAEESSSGTTPAALRMREAACRDLTREDTTEPRLPLQHVVVSLLARAEG